MNSLYDFIVKPYGGRYDNSIKVGDKELVLNTKIEAFKAVNNIAEVIAVPLAFKTNIKVGDKIIVHHNVFRIFYDIRGRLKTVGLYLKMTRFLYQLIKYICMVILVIGKLLETDAL
jgi:hypothetical protein